MREEKIIHTCNISIVFITFIIPVTSTYIIINVVITYIVKIAINITLTVIIIKIIIILNIIININNVLSSGVSFNFVSHVFISTIYILDKVK